MKAIAAAALVVAIAQSGQPSDPAVRPGDETATISGRVVDDRGDPVPAAAVVAAGGPAFPGARSAITTEDGRYTIPGVGAGFYTVSVGKAGFPTINVGQTRPNGPGKPVELKAGQRVTLPITLPRGAVITGTAVDDNGDPKSGSLAIEREVNGVMVPSRFNRILADGRGHFRAFGLAAGTYRILPSSPSANVDPRDLAAAVAVTVAPGDERDGIVVRQRGPQPTTYVTVSVSASDGQPLRTFRLSMRSLRDARAGNSGYSSNRPNPDGTRTLIDVAAGEYRIVAHEGKYWGAADVSVDGEHPAVAAITASPGVPVSGTASIDGVNPPRTRSVSVYLNAADSDGLVDDNNGIIGQINADGSFTAAGVPPGRYTLRLLGDEREGWQLGSVRLGGADVTDTALTVGQEPMTGVVVTLTKTTTKLAGAVTGRDGSPANSVDVVAFPIDPKYRVRNSRRVATARTTVDGRYEIQGLPPGEYGLAVVEDATPETFRDPASVAKLAPRARVTLTAGAAARVDIVR